jgi:hypothetical protein
MSDIIFDIYQSYRIADAKATATQAADKIQNLLDEQRHLERRIERLLLINSAMWELLKEHLPLSDIELRSKILEVDAADGTVDGRMGSRLRVCKHCEKMLHPKHDKCLYCGHDNTSSLPHRQV